MNKEQELENYLSISPNKFGLYLFDAKSFTILYKKELNLNDNEHYLDFSILKKFLDNNIFQIEKLTGKFVENIFLICDDKEILNLEIGIKKKNYNDFITKEYLENLLIEAKDLFRENYPNHEIIHMIVNKYYINYKNYLLFEDNIKSDHLALEINFKSISTSIINDFNKILENYQIKILKFLDENYVKSFFNKDLDLPMMSHKILNGFNANEVSFIVKNPKKSSFFEKFFQLFS